MSSNMFDSLSTDNPAEQSAPQLRASHNAERPVDNRNTRHPEYDAGSTRASQIRHTALPLSNSVLGNPSPLHHNDPRLRTAATSLPIRTRPAGMVLGGKRDETGNLLVDDEPKARTTSNHSLWPLWPTFDTNDEDSDDEVGQEEFPDTTAASTHEQHGGNSHSKDRLRGGKKKRGKRSGKKLREKLRRKAEGVDGGASVASSSTT